MKLNDFKDIYGDKYKFIAEYDLDTIRKAVSESNYDFYGKVPFVLEAGCVAIIVEVSEEEGLPLYGDYYISGKIDEISWRTFDGLSEIVDFNVPDIEYEMFRFLDEYVTEHGLSYTKYNGQQFTERMNQFTTLKSKLEQETSRPQIALLKARTVKLIDLVGCGLYDVQLFQSDEEIESATIVELNLTTLTEQGKFDWTDVLNAKVEEIAGGGSETVISLSDVDPQRLSDFSYMLAGHCSVQDYKKWVADENTQLPDQDMNM